MTSPDKKRTRRSVKEITRLLNDQKVKGYSTNDFCTRHGVSRQTYYNWQIKIRGATAWSNDFIAIETPAANAQEPIPFCDITISGSTSMRFYQPIDARFIKALNLY